MTKEEADFEPFKPDNVKVMGNCFVEKKVLDKHNTCVFQGQFYDKDKTRCTYTALPDSFARVQRKKECMEIFKKVGLDGYFSLPPYGIDLKRSYELLSTIDKDGNTKIMDLDGKVTEVKIDENLINVALHFKTMGALKLPYRLIEAERSQTFMEVIGTHETFKDLYQHLCGSCTANTST